MFVLCRRECGDADDRHTFMDRLDVATVPVLVPTIVQTEPFHRGRTVPRMPRGLAKRRASHSPAGREELHIHADVHRPPSIPDPDSSLGVVEAPSAFPSEDIIEMSSGQPIRSPVTITLS